MSNAPSLEEAMAFAGEATGRYQALAQQYAAAVNRHIGLIQRLDAWGVQIVRHAEPKLRSADPADQREFEVVQQIVTALVQILEEAKQQLPDDPDP
jgi:methionine synthase II (cobalamin-independent)